LAGSLEKCEKRRRMGKVLFCFVLFSHFALFYLTFSISPTPLQKKKKKSYFLKKDEDNIAILKKTCRTVGRQYCSVWMLNFSVLVLRVSIAMKRNGGSFRFRINTCISTYCIYYLVGWGGRATAQRERRHPQESHPVGHPPQGRLVF
jgi:hypothetical protein